MIEEYGSQMFEDSQTWDQEAKKIPKINIDGLLRVFNSQFVEEEASEVH
jgi:hypothetical protein